MDRRALLGIGLLALMESACAESHQFICSVARPSSDVVELGLTSAPRCGGATLGVVTVGSPGDAGRWFKDALRAALTGTPLVKLSPVLSAAAMRRSDASAPPVDPGASLPAIALELRGINDRLARSTTARTHRARLMRARRHAPWR
jgi:hypothetical protein